MKTVHVAAAVICRDDRIFATARGYGPWKGWWEFPGGKAEAGESPEEALTREIREELETEIAVGDLLDIVEYDYPEFHLSMHVFWAEIVRGELRLVEAEEARWLSGEHLREVRWLPADELLIPKIEKVLSARAKTVQ